MRHWPILALALAALPVTAAPLMSAVVSEYVRIQQDISRQLGQPAEHLPPPEACPGILAATEDRIAAVRRRVHRRAPGALGETSETAGFDRHGLAAVAAETEGLYGALLDQLGAPDEGKLAYHRAQGLAPEQVPEALRSGGALRSVRLTLRAPTPSVAKRWDAITLVLEAVALPPLWRTREEVAQAWARRAEIQVNRPRGIWPWYPWLKSPEGLATNVWLSLAPGVYRLFASDTDPDFDALRSAAGLPSRAALNADMPAWFCDLDRDLRVWCQADQPLKSWEITNDGIF